MPGRVSGRTWSSIVAILVAMGAAGMAGVSAQSPPTPPRTPGAHGNGPKAGHEGARDAQHGESPAKAGHEVNRLKALVEAGEQAAESKDWDGAITRADEAEVLVADWSEELLVQAEVLPLLRRLQDLEQHLPETETVPAVPDPGLKEAVEVEPLSGDELKAELAQVKNAEVGAVFDFPIDLNDKVLAWVHRFTTSKRGFMERTLSRGTRYLPMIRQIFAEERVPQDLAYLAVIESGYINSANSYAKAVGMWQFMRATGRIYGLNGNAWLEERRDPVKATRAAARYLRRLYETSGDWYLALVGYNAGPMTTERAIQNLGTRNFWDMHRSRWLRDQTKNYVPEMCAAVLIGRFPERYGLTIEQLPPYTYETVDIDRMTSLPVLAKFAGSDVDALRELNPELLRATTPPGHYQLRVPPGTSGATARALARIPASQRLDFQTYTIKKGDTLAKLAGKFKMGSEDLLAANELSKAQFKAGRVIKVPPPPPTPIDDRDLAPQAERIKAIGDHPLESLPAMPVVQPSMATEAVRETTPAMTPGPSETKDEPAAAPEAKQLEPVAPAQAASEVAPVKAKPATKKPAESRPVLHVVKQGETLFGIGMRYGLDLDDLRKWNKIKGNKIQPGQKLHLVR